MPWKILLLWKYINKNGFNKSGLLWWEFLTYVLSMCSIWFFLFGSQKNKTNKTVFSFFSLSFFKHWEWDCSLHKLFFLNTTLEVKTLFLLLEGVFQRPAIPMLLPFIFTILIFSSTFLHYLKEIMERQGCPRRKLRHRLPLPSYHLWGNVSSLPGKGSR